MSKAESGKQKAETAEPKVAVGFRFRLCGEVFRIVALTKRGIACRRVKEVAG